MTARSVPDLVATEADGPTGAAGAADVSVIVPCRNELARLPAFLASLEAQTDPPCEVVVADGASTDGSRAWWDDAASSRDWLVVLDNPGCSIPQALNLALRHASGELVARMDTHASYAPDYLAEVTAPLRTDGRIVGSGGAMESAGATPTGRAVAAVLRRPLGMGGAAHRVGGTAGPVDHVFSGCYRRSAVLAAGGFDEGLAANEDFELDVRLRRAGGIVWLTPSARSTWSVPDEVGALAAKMFRYGRWKAGTLRRHPGSVRARQLVPPALVLALAGLAALRPSTGLLALTMYVSGTGAAAAAMARADGASPVRAVPVPAVVHLSWGTGLLVGAVEVLASALRPSSSRLPTEEGATPR